MGRIGIAEKPKVVDLTKKAVTAETLTEARITCSLEDKVDKHHTLMTEEAQIGESARTTLEQKESYRPFSGPLPLLLPASIPRANPGVH